MQGSAWIGLLRRVPENLHNALSLGLMTGAEVVVQQIIKLESDVIILRGRMSGSTAEGRVLIVSYAQLALVAFNKHISEDDIKKIFGTPLPKNVIVAEAPAEPAVEHVQSDSYEAEVEESVEEEAAPPEVHQEPVLAKAAPPVASPVKTLPSPPSKSMLLARLRERLAERK